MKIELQQDKSFGFPMGLTTTDRGIHVRVVSGSEVALLFYRRNEKEIYRKIAFPQSARIGDVWSIYIVPDRMEDFQDIEYNFQNEDGIFSDPYGKSFSGRDGWGKKEQFKNIRRSPVFIKKYEGDMVKRPYLRWDQIILYRLHIRGFTKSSSSKVIHKGTFFGLTEKIDYLKRLGINAVDIMPCQEFEELIFERPRQKYAGERAGEDAQVRLNYWGYAAAHHFAPKASYCRKKNRDPVNEFKYMVEKLHKAGIEVFLEFFFTGEETITYITELIHYWVYTYRIDGVHIIGKADVEALAKDPFLTDVKLIYEYWEDKPRRERKCLAIFNDAFQNDMRRFLKGDEGQIHPLIANTRRNPEHAAVLNYIADIKGFSMADMLSYDIKHNEANGEDNHDGTEFNYSWNCGEEGKSRKKKVLALRKKQLRNASVLVFLSQGTPVFASGDEIAQGREGNNNAYCQDNPLSWMNWKLLRHNAGILEWFQYLIAFRKNHPVFRYPKEPTNMDCLGYGVPDVSYHGEKVWQPQFENHRRQLGILYNGRYAKKEDGTEDDSFFVMYNMHWETHDFDLPRLPKGIAWHLCMDTGREDINGYLAEGEEEILSDQKKFSVNGRSIIVLRGKKDNGCI